MSQPISIIVRATGERIDVAATETIEVNMGGISLLSLGGRTQSYTNTFKLPRTPRNEVLFGFVSQPTRSNVAELDVVITKGLFYQEAKLKVTAFDESYSCTLSYDYEGVIAALAEQNFYTLPVDGKKTTIKEDAPEPTADVILAAVTAQTTDGTCFSPMMYRTDVSTNTAAMSFYSFVERVQTLLGVTFAGDILSDDVVMSYMIFNKYITFTYSNSFPNPDGYYFQQNIQSGDIDFKSCGEVLKALSQLCLFDVIINGTTITLKSVSSMQAGTPIAINGFTFSKDIYSGYGATSIVKYKVNETIPDTFGADTFPSNGVGETTALEMLSYIPINYANQVSPNVRGGYNCSDSNALKEIIIMAAVGIEATSSYPMYWSTYSKTSSSSFSTITGNPIALGSVYSTPLSCMANPVILDANGYLNPLQAQQVIDTRLITSIQMGGTYWVDSMAYDLNSGRTKMKLIKLT